VIKTAWANWLGLATVLAQQSNPILSFASNALDWIGKNVPVIGSTIENTVRDVLRLTPTPTQYVDNYVKQKIEEWVETGTIPKADLEDFFQSYTERILEDTRKQIEDAFSGAFGVVQRIFEGVSQLVSPLVNILISGIPMFHGLLQKGFFPDEATLYTLLSNVINAQLKIAEERAGT